MVAYMWGEIGFERAISLITSELIQIPLTDVICGEAFKVSLGSLFDMFGNSPYRMLKHYAKLTGKKFPYTPRCFIGPPEARLRRMRGEFSSYDVTLMKDAHGHYDVSIFGLPRYVADEKQVVRDVMVEEAIRTLEDVDVCYLGVETAEFLSLKLIAEEMNLRPEYSVVVELNERMCLAMRTMAPRIHKGFGRLDIIQGAMEEELARKVRGSFNFVNFDVPGHMSKPKEEMIRLLLERDLLQNTAVVFVTLWDEKVAQSRAARRGYGHNQVAAVTKVFERYAKRKYEVSFLFDLPYQGGRERKNATPMVTIGFALNRLEISVED